MANVTYSTTGLGNSGGNYGPTAQNPFQGPAGTTPMAKAYMNYLGNTGQQNPYSGQYTPDGKLTSFLPGGDNYEGSSTSGGGGGGLWSGGGSTGALTGLGSKANTRAMQNAQLETARKQSSIVSNIDTLIRQAMGSNNSAIYKEAAQQAINQINLGLQQAQTSTNSGLNVINKDLNSTLEALKNYRDTARGDVTTGYGDAIGTFEGGQAQSRADLEKNYGDAIDRFNVLSQLVPEAIGNYRDQVLSDFDQQFAKYQQSQAYQFGLNEQLKAIQAQASSGSGTDNSAVLKAQMRFAQDYASQHYMAYQQMQYGQAKDYLDVTSGALTNQAQLQAGLGDQLSANNNMYSSLIGGAQIAQGQDLAGIEGNYATGQQQAYANRSQLASGLYQQLAALQAQAGAQRANYQYQGGTAAANQRPQLYNSLAALANAGLSV